MRKKYLGDSYDLVKRFWSEALRPIAPLYAHPRFVPSDIRAEYTVVTTIRILDIDKPPQRPFGILLDPDTGIPWRAELRSKAKRSHAPLPFIVEENRRLQPAYMICFDQSHHRSRELKRAAQMETKRDYLRERGIESFYYFSHAPFLFMAGNSGSLAAIRRELQKLGIPDRKFEIDPVAS